MSEPTYTREEFLSSCITPAVSSPFMSTECSICQEPYGDSTDGSPVTFSDKNTCNHVFCRACIISWLSVKTVNTCAMCRRVLFALPPMYDDEYDDYDDGEEYDADYGEDYGEDYDEDDGGYFADYYSEDFREEGEYGAINFGYNMGALSGLRLRLPPVDRNDVLPEGFILEILQTIWFKTWWLLSCYRCYVSHARDNSLGPFSWCPHQGITDAQARFLLPGTICLIDTLLCTMRNSGIDSIFMYGSLQLKVVAWLVHDMATILKAHIDTTDGIDCVPDFPLWKQSVWGEPLQWLLALPLDSEYTRVPTFF